MIFIEAVLSSCLFSKDCASISLCKLSSPFLFLTGSSGVKVVSIVETNKILNYDFVIHTVICLHFFISIMVYTCMYVHLKNQPINPNLIYSNITPLKKNTITKKQLYTITMQSLIICALMYYNRNSCNTI